MANNFLQKVFSVKNEYCHKVITILGLKIKIKNKNKALQDSIFYFFQRNEMVSSLLDEKVSQLASKNDVFENSLNNITHIINCMNKPFLYDKNGWEMPYLEKFLQDINSFDLKLLYQNLVKNLDAKSVDTVNSILSRTYKICNSNEQFVDIFTQNEMAQIQDLHKRFWGKLLQLNQDCWALGKYLLPINHFEICVFEDKHCIDMLNTNYFKNKHIIDAGGFIGDSAIVFSDYTSEKVHSFEPTSNNFQNLLKTIELNSKNNIVAVNKALGDKNGSLELFANGSASGLLDVHNTQNSEVCEMITLDEYVQHNNLAVGLIKTDLEGAEQLFLRGAATTIKTQRPTLLISIYHTADDFFKIKPLIESWNLNYDFKIVKPLDGQVLLETLLICEPKEIIND